MRRSVSLRFLLVSLLCLARPYRISAQSTVRLVHVFVALADNIHQGIVPVPAKLGDGDAPAGNLYWGAAFGVKSFFRTSAGWDLVWPGHGPKEAILERCVFKHHGDAIYLIADAYEGSQIREAVTDFLSAAAGLDPQTLSLKTDRATAPLPIGGGADLVAYVGHDAFMDFQLAPVTGQAGTKARNAIVLASASKAYFAPYLKATGAEPLLWTTGLMAPEA
jgi:hypothetical protein